MRRTARLWTAGSLSLVLAACGGGGGGDSSKAPEPVPVATDQVDAVRLAQQASFGPSEALVTEIRAAGAATWIHRQMQLSASRYTHGGGDVIHKGTGQSAFCETGAQKSNPNCWRDYFSSIPLAWDFYRNAVGQPDQLRQRVAMALAHFLVVSGRDINGTYGLRNYQNRLLEQAFGNYRDVLRSVTLSPVMGDYLNHVNNDPVAPNENFARELLQLFSLGTCELNADGSLHTGQCVAVYDNNMVRSYAYALTGWTYPAGGTNAGGCWPRGSNCRYYGGEMTAVPARRDTQERTLLGGVVVPGNATPAQALDKVLDSVMQHANVAPFVARQLIQQLVASDPDAAYVGRVAAAFNAGRYVIHQTSGDFTFGDGVKGNLAATVAATLLDTQARGAPGSSRAGHLRAPALLFTGALRAFGGHTDGDPFTWWWGETLQQHMFRPMTVFGYYPPDYPVPGTSRIGPEFGIHNTNGALERLNYLTYLFQWGGSPVDLSVPDAVGTGVDVSAFTASADQADALVDRVSLLLLGRTLAATPRAKVIEAVSYWNASRSANLWRQYRVATAAFLVLASPDYQVQP